MLGVLAIVGILSLVGIAGFQKAMVTHRTNQLVEDMRLAGLIVLDEWLDRLTLEEMSLEGKFDQQTPYDFTVALENENADTFVIMADGVAYNICEEVIKKEPQWAEEIIANGEENACHEGGNLIGFFFNDAMGKLSDFCTKDSDCGECGKCNNRRCSYGFKNRSGQCQSCDDPTGIWLVDEEECHKCKNRIYIAHNGRCDNCNVSDRSSYGSLVISNISEEECNRCSDRMFSSYYAGTNATRCIAPMEPRDNFWLDIPEGECEKFPNQYSVNGNCLYCEGTFNTSTGVCSTTNCEHNSWSSDIFGLDENTCTQLCGGTFLSYYGVARCHLP